MSIQFRPLSSKIILTTVSLMFVFHFVLFTIYTQNHKWHQHEVHLAETRQKLLNTIHMVKGTAEEDLQKAIDAIKEPNLEITLSDAPKYLLQFDEVSYWKVGHHLLNQHVDENSNSISLSMQLQDGRWLNMAGLIVPDTLSSHLLLLLLELFVVITILLYAWSINRFTGPLKDFRKAAERLGVDLDSSPLVEYGPTIVRETAQAMNKMQQRIRDLVRDRTQMLAAISHDLRTPITRLKLRAQKIQDVQLANKCISDCDAMESMIAELLAFAKEDMATENKVKLDFNSMLQTICDEMIDMGGVAEFKPVDSKIIVLAKTTALKRAITNLIHNAIKYGNCARITCYKKNNKVIATIEDDGPGIPDDKLEKVFAPFYRVESSRSRGTAGTGLGLAVARDIIRAHHGDILLKNSGQGGLIATIQLAI